MAEERGHPVRGQAIGVLADRPDLQPLAFEVACGLARYWARRGLRVAVRPCLRRRAARGLPAGEPCQAGLLRWARRQRARVHFSLACLQPVPSGSLGLRHLAEAFDRLVRVRGPRSQPGAVGPMAEPIDGLPAGLCGFAILERDGGRQVWVSAGAQTALPRPGQDGSWRASSLGEAVACLACLMLVPVAAAPCGAGPRHRPPGKGP